MKNKPAKSLNHKPVQPPIEKLTYDYIWNNLYNRLPVLEVYINLNFALSDYLIKYKLVNDHDDFYNKIRTGYIKMRSNRPPHGLEHLKGVDDRKCLKNGIIWRGNGYHLGFCILTFADNPPSTVLLHIRKYSTNRELGKNKSN